MTEYLAPELIYKCSRMVWSTTSGKLWKVVRVLLFNVRSWFFDLKYKSIGFTELREALQRYASMLEESQLEYTSDYFDCDDYALTFKSFVTKHYRTNAVGIALGLLRKGGEVLGGHAWNIALMSDGDLVFVEPQTREIIYGNVSSDGYEYELQAVVW